MTGPAPERRDVPWDMSALSEAPDFEAAPGFRAEGKEENEAEGVGALFYDGLPWRGEPTRVFAWFGVPEMPEGGSVPGMVLVHGGGGTAFADWVRLWMDRGYAAISMDTCGCTGGGKHGERPRHPDGGPPGWGGFDQLDGAVEDQWMYHAVADVCLAMSLLRSRPEVDADRIGLTGISWGAVVACVAAGIDPRFAFVCPVYGCGAAEKHAHWGERAAAMGARAEEWLGLWDPSRYLGAARAPFLWLTGTNDFAFPLNALQDSYRLAPGERTLSVRLRMPHGQWDGAKPEEIRVFADGLLTGGVPLARVDEPVVEPAGDVSLVRVGVGSQVPISRAELLYTKDLGYWPVRDWDTAPAALGGAGCTVEAEIPEGASVCFLNLTDERGLVVSSEHVELDRR